ncbi:MAG: CPBP family intramembrane metalloprotease [Candidatus Heimdallarchaeota archaeon]|nr:CPBP family intramembrane metalloprotease [Candidatus Heimdallarchaeota archaeon]
MDTWLKEFSILVVVTAIVAGLSYAIQFYIFDGMNFDEWNVSGSFIRMIRMASIYILPVLWFTKRHGGSWKDLGVLPSKNYPLLSTLGGMAVYFIAVWVFLRYRIFFGNWGITPWSIIWIKFAMICVMASVTDFWTRGFILLELAKRYNDKIAIFWQNVTWFSLHIYEIVLLEPYIGYLGAIALTLTLGIGGDLIALKTRSITGLMLGHCLLNLGIILAANDVLFFYKYIAG